MDETRNIRVRFAPSPTGFLHVGGLRTALYNFLFAKKTKGKFILRIEDTDRARIVEGATNNLIETLHWAGIDYDEGPIKGGPFGPYVQSERLEIYRKHVTDLLSQGQSYRCFCTPERLEEMRKQQEKMHISPKYDRKCLRLTSKEINDNLSAGKSYVVRMKVPETSTIKFHDIVRGDVEFAGNQLDDQVLMKSDGYPTYHLANVVDDHLMQISHVIRGEEWLSSTPKHVLLYSYFGWVLPAFAHLPLLLNPDRSKLSKRQGDVAVEDYRSKGYLKEALINFIVLLGWNPGTEQEFFYMEDLIQQFSLGQVNKSGAVFNVEKLDWLNFEHLRKKPDEEVLFMLREALSRSRVNKLRFEDQYLLRVIHVMRKRISFIKDIIDNSPYFFERPKQYNESVVSKRWNNNISSYLEELIKVFSSLSNPSKEDYENVVQTTAERLHIKNSELIHAVRLAVSGVGGGPGLYELLDILGKDETIERIREAILKIK